MPYHEKKVIIIWIHVYPNWKMCFNSIIGNKRIFSYETKSSISLIPRRIMCLWYPIMKRKDIIMWIHVYPNWNMNFNSKISNKGSFYCKTKASISLIPIRKMCLWFPIMERKEIICESMFIPIERCTSILKLVITEVFLMRPKHQSN